MELQKAQSIADEIVSRLKPFCSRISVAGSIRRQKPWVRDVDIIAIPSSQGQFIGVLQTMGVIKMGGKKLIRVELQYGYPSGLMLDIYIATAETWATLLLIRTGSTLHNIKLCKLALSKNMKLHADGSGLFKIEAQGCEGVEVRIAGDSEESIFEKLELPYEEPEKRE
jgi:DNA polymerase (family 10)